MSLALVSWSLLTTEPLSGKNHAFPCLSILFRPPYRCVVRCLKWWRRRVPPPGPVHVLDMAFITIEASKPATGKNISLARFVVKVLEIHHNGSMVMSRPSSDYLDDLIKRGHRFEVLDHGFVRVVDYMGTDQAIVQAARVSYGTGTKNLRADEGLIRYLLRHRHTTPFEMCELKLHVKMPIFVARQWIRHRTANVNEYSGRYSVMSEDFYLPDETWLDDSLRRQKDELEKKDGLFEDVPQEALKDTAEQSQHNKQGRGALLTERYAFKFLKKIRAASEKSYRAYVNLLGGKKGDGEALARELARIVLPLNMYTEWYWKCDVHNLLHFLALRLHPHAQHEIQVYAKAIYQIMEEWLPITARAFADYRLESVYLSKKQKQAVQELLQKKTPDYEALGLSGREIDELKKQFML